MITQSFVTEHLKLTCQIHAGDLNAFAAAKFVMLATWRFIADYWGPGMLSGTIGTSS